jgi:hypothetical protein
MRKFVLLNLTGVVVAAVTLATLGAATSVCAMTAQQCVQAGDRCHRQCTNDNFGGPAIRACQSKCGTIEFFCVTKSSDLGDAAQKRKERGDKKEGGGKLPPKGGKSGTTVVIDPTRPPATGNWTTAPAGNTGPLVSPIKDPATKTPPSSIGGLLSKPYGGKLLP